MKVAATTLARLSLLAGLVASPLAAAKKQEFTRPPYAGAYEPQGVDERGLWMQIDELERPFRDSAFVLRDARLEGHLRSVLCMTVGFDRCGAARIYVVKDNSFNASMFPNGVMLIHVGLLARVHSDAELATVLGHEFAHFELRHSLQSFRKQRTATDVLAWVSLAGVATNQNTSSIQNIVAMSFFSFSRAQEADADLLAAAYVRASPYRLRASQVWKRLLDEHNALRAERGMRKVKRYYPEPTETHPTDLQRIAYFTKLEAEAGEDGDDALAEYRSATAPFLPQLFDSLVKGNEFAAADFVIRARGDVMGWDAPLLTLRGELYRMRANPRDLVTARAFFERATTFPDAPAESWRGLGLTALRLGEPDVGKEALAQYLRHQPDALDASTIKLLLEK